MSQTESTSSLSKNKPGTKPANFQVSKLSEWRGVLSGIAEKHGSVYAVADTETTGTRITEPKTGLFNRILELGICFCYKNEDGYLVVARDNGGDPIVIDEPSNPFITLPRPSPKQLKSVKEIDKESIEVHGITLDYLFGESEGMKSRPKLSRGAPTFDVVMETVQSLISVPPLMDKGIPAISVFHNAVFDINFLNHECECWGISHFESYFAVEDTLVMAKKVFGKDEIPDFTLDSIYAYGKENYPELIDNVERPIHSAIIDCMILVQVYNIIWHHHKLKSQK